MNPFDIATALLQGMRRLMAHLTPFVVGLLSLLLTLYLAFESSELHSADMALREYQDWVHERPQEKLYQAWRMYRYEGVLHVQGPPLTQLVEYQKLVEEARLLIVKRHAITNMLQDAAVTRYVPTMFEHHGPEWLQIIAMTANGSGAAELHVETLEPTAAVGPERPGTGLPFVDEWTSKKPADANADCVTPKLMRTVVARRAVGTDAGELDHHMHEIACYLRAIGVSEADYEEPLWSLIYATRTKVNLLVTWLLPALYGLLGSCVFVMRSILLANGGVARRDDARILDLLSLLMRVALGGLAGIIVGWFWVPSAASTSSAISISSVPFGVAFLSGFSIESLFSLLERMSKALEDPERRNKGK